MKRTLLSILLVAACDFALAQDAGSATVGISQNEALGDFLVDAEGMTLYLFTKDTENTSTCYGVAASADRW